MTPVSSKANVNHVGVEMDVKRERMEDGSLKACRTQPGSLVNFGRPLSKTVTESPLNSPSRFGSNSESLRTSKKLVRETVLPAAEESEDEGSTLSNDYLKGHNEGRPVEVVPSDWSRDVRCDLCERGVSLSLGAWYSWCCGNPSRGCSCSFDDIQRKKKALLWKAGKKWKASNPPYPWSGKVHKRCALWSAEAFEEPEHSRRILQIDEAVKRTRRIKCSDSNCGLFGATLGCRVNTCRRSFHYPCADNLAALVKVRMCEGMSKPVTCFDHLHVNDENVEKESKKRKKGKTGLSPLAIASPSEVRVRAPVIILDSSDEEDNLPLPTAQDVIRRWNTGRKRGSRFALTKSAVTPNSWPRATNAGPAYLGKNLLVADISNGLEPVKVPCTNDVDRDPPPFLNEYMTKSRYRGQPLGSRTCSHPLMNRPAKACNGCHLHDPDDPAAPMSVHIPFQNREDDFREDWQKERMYGRLPYDKHGRLVIGTEYNELVECNDRCKCGDNCINREMQKGLRIPIELYKTVEKGWAVRTLVPIPRGRFVIEFVGDVLTQDEAQKFGQVYDEIKRSYLYDLDYPESKRTPDFTLDGFHASNVARFINHSCDANLKIYRVYVETTYKWLPHIGMYAQRDIEAGEELSYDYNYSRHELQAHDGKSNLAEAGKQRNKDNDSTHIKCYCRATNCREWLWRPFHSGEDSD